MSFGARDMLLWDEIKPLPASAAGGILLHFATSLDQGSAGRKRETRTGTCLVHKLTSRCGPNSAYVSMKAYALVNLPWLKDLGHGRLEVLRGLHHVWKLQIAGAKLRPS